jgi:predicted transposase/invertase (TIGR01784 family)
MEFSDKYINPLTDFGFKKLFGEEVNKDLLIDFLNQLLPEKHNIKNLTYQQNERLPSSEYDRKAIFDLYCESDSGEKFIVELQRAKQNYFKDRSVYYASFPIQQQAIKGSDWDFKLQAVYTIGILDFIFEEDKNDKQYIQTVQLKNQKNKVFYDKLTFIYIELPKFEKTVDNLETKIEKWLFVFRYLARLQNRPDALQERIFHKLFAAAEIAKYSREEKELYEESLKYYRDFNNVVDTAFDEGKIEGKIEGRLKGRLKGKLKWLKN